MQESDAGGTERLRSVYLSPADCSTPAMLDYIGNQASSSAAMPEQHPSLMPSQNRVSK